MFFWIHLSTIISVYIKIVYYKHKNAPNIEIVKKK